MLGVGIRKTEKRNGTGSHKWGGHQNNQKDVNELAAKSNKLSTATTTLNSNTAGKPVQDNAKGTHTSNAKAFNSENHDKDLGTKVSSAASDDHKAEPSNAIDTTEAEIKEWTLDEWKAQKQQRIKPQFNIRKAGEGEDTSQWKQMIALNKKNKKDQDTEGELLEYDSAIYSQRVGRQQRILDIQFNFNDERRRSAANTTGYRRGGYNAGAARGAPNTGSQRNDKLSQRGTTNQNRYRRPFNAGNTTQSQPREECAAPKVNDERQFPTLS